MGGHGGLNILPQKRWNVYNFDNREKVRKDEEAAAKQEQLSREQSRKRHTELRIQQLRQARGLASASSEPVPVPVAKPDPIPEAEPEPKSKHINLFEGIRFLDPIVINNNNNNKRRMSSGDDKQLKRMKKEVEKVKAVLPEEDEKYRLGYGVAGKGVKVPWYLEKRVDGEERVGGGGNGDECGLETVTKSNRKKSVEELREERLKREGREKERERALVRRKGRHEAVARNGGYSRRR
ncbi:uncharacterized protein LOC143604838 [Bidens hawaiensis]|uniref:uncharacterized protein LOC143604838 n=1 Tax=Bidens hawaiensis TaxID=980011 RepID=UPI00404AB51A